MAYSDFKLEDVLTTFELSQHSASLFDNVEGVALGEWLTGTLQRGKKLALVASTEKARSEFIVAPILLEIENRHPEQLAIYSGKRFDVDKQLGLVGECDFLLSKGPMRYVIEAPVFSLVEAKKQDLELGLGQCAAQMIGASLFNEQHGKLSPVIYGCVTTGESWQFLQLNSKALTIDPRVYYFNELELVLGIFETIFRQMHPSSE